VLSADRYLQRIGMPAQTGPATLELLAALQLAHIVNVPFENLHVFHHRGVRTDVGWSYPKIVEQQRGGWCFEVNGSFGALLRAVGFDVDYIACKVWNGPDGWGPPFDHLGLIVRVDGERWFADVGFGDNCLVPLPIRDGVYAANPRHAQIEVTDDAFELTELMPEEGWLKQLRAELRPVQLADFEPRSEYLQHAPDLGWSTKPFATRALDGDGSRITLRRDVLRRRTADGPFVDRGVAEDEWSDLLVEHFGLIDSLTSRSR
jgi:N-hydroxyarylamine O-acetyltransferase